MDYQLQIATLSGTDPERRDWADFADPDGNTRVIQETGYRPTF